MSGWKPVNTRLKNQGMAAGNQQEQRGAESSMRFAYNRRSSPFIYRQIKKERMDIFVIGICSLLLLAIVAALTTKFARRKEGEPEVVMLASGDCSSCDGTDDKCEQVCMMEAATKEVEYYDDEELDRFRGRQSDQYTDKEAEEFAEVLYTMQPHEAKGWNRSLILRDINVPDQIKDELIAMIEG
ncbi:hypothetical protein HMPREF9141_1816 [Prevotella multiformis DSM 16608]|uniref:Uncharacterized protein n=2 Tax=Prevotella multiformis TaxID=282402 RepID=F0F899_9BACT|nr:hypothetical protein HMPREF9141_1816 [Prevotella multiformis DSM 16608]